MSQSEEKEFNRTIANERAEMELWRGPAPQVSIPQVKPGLITSLDLRSAEDRKHLFAMTMGATVDGDIYLKKVIKVRHVVITPAQKPNEKTGELEHWPRTVLLLDDGTRISFGSYGIVKSLGLYCLCFSPPPWNPPAKLFVNSEKLGVGNWYTLQDLETAGIKE